VVLSWYGGWKKENSTHLSCPKDRCGKNKVPWGSLWVYEKSWMSEEGINSLVLKDNVS
jgi:hypothetical protein